MKLFMLNIPEDTALLPAWLERHLLGFALGELAGELAAVHGEHPGKRQSIREVLGSRLELVLMSGLKAAPPEALRQLLKQPELLLELQQIVLEEGGPYWDQNAQAAQPPPEVADLIGKGRRILEKDLALAEAGGPEMLPFHPAPRKTGWNKRGWLTGAGVAAAVLLGVVLTRVFDPAPQPADQPEQTAWGWNKPGALPADVSREEYLQALAKAGQAWFNKRPEGKAELAQRIAQLRQGCSTLIFASHTPLPDRDRKWLVQKCQIWAEKLTKQLVALESGRDPMQVRAEADTTVNQLVKALETRAKETAAS